MDATGAQQWLTDLPPQFFLPKKERLVPHYFHPTLNQRRFETRAAMASPDWNDFIKVEDDNTWSDAHGFAVAENDDFLPPEAQQSPWGAVSSHLTSQQPTLTPGLSDGHAAITSTGWPLRQVPITPQSSLISHQGDNNHSVASGWSLSLTGNDSMNFLESYNTSSAGTAQTNQYQCSEVAPPSETSSSYPSNGAIPFNIRTGSMTPYIGKADVDSTMENLQGLHGSSWELFNPFNQYPTVPVQPYLPSQPTFTERYHGLPIQAPATAPPAASVPEPQPFTRTPARKSFLDDTPYNVDSTWPEWQKFGNKNFSNDSELASPVSSKVTGNAQARFGGHSFCCSSVDSSAALMPGLTYSQASPASDWDDLSSSYPGEQQALVNEGNVTYPQRNLRSHTQRNSNNGNSNSNSNNRFATLAHQRMCDHAEWAATNDKYTRVNGKRVRKDDLLVKWKNAGMSYRQIKEKGRFAEAESTLRGRFRTLTKKREERVRKPLWKAEDVRLLREGVKTLMAASLYPGAEEEALEVDKMDVDANKVPWKKVAEHIWDNGGSYRFGNATCKKQWLKIQGML